MSGTALNLNAGETIQESLAPVRCRIEPASVKIARRQRASAMNYRHAYHAGNFADVVKHAVLCRVLVHLREKPAAFRVIDTHAGAGRYDLAGPEAGKTQEWRDGIDRLRRAELAAPMPRRCSRPISTRSRRSIPAARSRPIPARRRSRKRCCGGRTG